MDMCSSENNDNDDKIRRTVRRGYAGIARSGESCCGDRSCCSQNTSAKGLARSIGYSDEELADLPQGANMGLSCGNPTALASLSPGEVVLDLGSGGGFDVFIAARKVGPRGSAIGVDMTPEMVTTARENARQFRTTSGLENVEFRLGEIEHLPVADASVDVVISNCVINLSPDKKQVWQEMARVLKPGGRVAVSDIALKRRLPEDLRDSAEALVGCVAGAVLIEDTRRMAKEAGLTDIRLEEDPSAVESMTESNDDLYRQTESLLPAGEKPSDYIVSLKISGRRPEEG